METQRVKILILDDEPGHIHWMDRLYTKLGLTVFGALSIDEARQIFEKEAPQIVTIETYIHNSHWFLQEIRKQNKETVRVVITTLDDQDYFDFLKNMGLAEYCLNKYFDDKGCQRLEDIIMEIASLIRIA